MLFKEMNLPDYLLRAIEKEGFTEATEIQEKCIPVLKSGKDCIGQSQTGSGKTFAFGVPLIERVDVDDTSTQILIVCPTRELASQICDELRKLTYFREGIKVVPIYGGSSMDRQIQALKRNSKVVVGTPGRLMDHLRRKTLKLHNLKTIVLDEADEMLDMGFREDIETILQATNSTHQTCMFSATMPAPIMALTKKYMTDPEFIEVSRTALTYDIKQHFIYMATPDKEKVLTHLLETLKPALSIIFCNTKRMVDSLTKKLQGASINAIGLHGDMRQGERKRVMQSIKNGNNAILVATDVAARGIDIHGVDVVFNYDIPLQSEYYTHRIGRTGRAGKHGEAYIFLNTKNQINELERIEKETKNTIEEFVCEFSKPVVKDYKPSKARVISGGGYGKSSKKNDNRSKQNGDKSFNNKSFGKKTYDRKPDGQRPFEEKPFEKKSYDRKPNGQRPYGKKYSNDRDFDDTKSGQRPFDKKPDGQRPYEKKFNKDRNLENKQNGQRPFEDKPFKDSEAPRERSAKARSGFVKSKDYGNKPSHFKGDKSFEKKPYGKKFDDKNSFEKQSGQRPYEKKFSKDRNFDDKPAKRENGYGNEGYEYTDKKQGEYRTKKSSSQKSYGQKSYGKKPYGQKSSSQKSYGKKSFGTPRHNIDK